MGTPGSMYQIQAPRSVNLALIIPETGEKAMGRRYFTGIAVGLDARHITRLPPLLASLVAVVSVEAGGCPWVVASM